MCPFTKRDWEGVFLGGVSKKKLKKVKKVDLESKRKVPFGTYHNEFIYKEKDLLLVFIIGPFNMTTTVWTSVTARA